MTIPSLFEDQASPSLFEGINARYYRAVEVARSFVPNEQFENITVRQHSVLVGPRGSGKTTLLRMLHPECLRVWEHPNAGTFRSQIEFTSVYVATDRVWRDQTDGIAAVLPVDQRERFVADIIGLDVMAGMLRTLELRTSIDTSVGRDFRAVTMSEGALARLCSELATGWRLSPKFLDLASLRVAVRSRRMEARRWADSWSNRPVNHDTALGVRWDEVALLGIDAFESATGIRDELWAILFDELEIVPAAVRDSILASTRGMDRRLLIKCSLSPWLSEHSLSVEDHDPDRFQRLQCCKAILWAPQRELCLLETSYRRPSARGRARAPVKCTG